MTIQPTDLLLVQRGQTLYKVEAAELGAAAPGGGPGAGVRSVSADSPLEIHGTNTDPIIHAPMADQAQAGFMSAADKARLDALPDDPIVAVGAQAPIQVNQPSVGHVVLAVPDATPGASGLLSAADKTLLDQVRAGGAPGSGASAGVQSVSGTGAIQVTGPADAPVVGIIAATSSNAGAMTAADKIKLDGLPAGAEANVQADWNETDATSDAFIRNKPTSLTVPAATTLAAGIVRLATDHDVDNRAADAAATAAQLGRVTDHLGLVLALMLPEPPLEPTAVKTSVWHEANDTLAVTGSLQVKVGTGAWGTGGPVANGQVISVRWDPDVVKTSNHGTTLQGELSVTTVGAKSAYEAVIDRLANGIYLAPVEHVPGEEWVTSAESTRLSGVNVPVWVWGTSESSEAAVAIEGGPWIQLPDAPGELSMNAGERLRLRHRPKAGFLVQTHTGVYVGDATVVTRVEFTSHNIEAAQPDLGVVTLSEVTPGGARFESKEFRIHAPLLDPGDPPASDYGVRAWVEAVQMVPRRTSAIQTVTPPVAPVVPGTFRLKIDLTSNSQPGIDPATLTGWTDELASGTDFWTALKSVQGLTSDRTNRVYIDFGANFANKRLDFYFDSGSSSAALYRHTSDDDWSNEQKMNSLDGAVPWIATTRYACIGYNISTRYTPQQVLSTAKVTSTVPPAPPSAGNPNTVLDLADATGLPDFSAGMAVKLLDGTNADTGITAVIDSISSTTVELRNLLGGTPAVGQKLAGPDKPGAAALSYLKLAANGAVTGLQASQPAWAPLTFSSDAAIIRFGAQLGAASTDLSLPAGTSMTVEVQVSNPSGSDLERSAPLTPGGAATVDAATASALSAATSDEVAELAAVRASAEAKLAALGLTAAELAALGIGV